MCSVKEFPEVRGKAASLLKTRHKPSVGSLWGVLIPQSTSDWKEQTHSSCFGKIQFTNAGCSYVLLIVVDLLVEIW